MARPPKLTKWVLENSLRHTSNISEVARSLGVKRDTVYGGIKRFGLSIPTLLREPVACAETADAESKPQPQVTQAKAVEPKDEAAKPEPERNIQRLPISDFTGVNLSERPRRPRRYY